MEDNAISLEIHVSMRHSLAIYINPLLSVWRKENDNYKLARNVMIVGIKMNKLPSHQDIRKAAQRFKY